MENKVYSIITERVINGLQQNLKWAKKLEDGQK